MAAPGDDVEQWLTAARTGSAEALGRVLDGFRAYLLAVAQRELDPALHAKGGASDLVQETLLDACRDFGRFQGQSADELRAWLRQVLHNNVATFGRRYREAEKRAVGREVPLPGGDGSSAAGELAGSTATPSAQASSREQDEALRLAVEKLPEEYRRVLIMRFQESQSFEEIGQQLGLTPNAARKLWLRAVKRLQSGTTDLP